MTENPKCYFDLFNFITFTSPLPALTSPLGTEKLELEDGGKFPISLSSSVSQSMLQLSSFEAFPSYGNQITPTGVRSIRCVILLSKRLTISQMQYINNQLRKTRAKIYHIFWIGIPLLSNLLVEGNLRRCFKLWKKKEIKTC